MAKKPPGKAEQTKHFLQLAVENDHKLKEIMAIIQEQGVKTEDVVTIPYPPLKEAWAIITDSMAIITLYPSLGEYATELGLRMDSLDKFFNIYTPTVVDDKLTIPDATFDLLMNNLLNKMTNIIHNAGIKLSGDTQAIAGCEVQPFEPEDAPFVGKYCAGVIPIAGKALVTTVPFKKITIEGKKKVQSYPTHIIHKLGVHHVEPSGSVSGDKVELAIQYEDSYLHHSGSTNRLKGTRERLEQEGFECHLGTAKGQKYGDTKQIYCWGDATPDEVRQLATFFSLLFNGDVSGVSGEKDFDKVIKDKAWELALKYNQQYGDDVWQKAPPHQLDWGSLYHQWLQEKELYEKKAIYEDLRNLTIFRDQHHAIESKYGIEAPGAYATKESADAILNNADAALKIIQKNKWPDDGFASSIKHFESAVAAKKPVGGTGGPSDSIGHILHMILVNKLLKEGTYGGCPMVGHIGNISAGNLSYCEGVLKGENATLDNAGNTIIHKVLPPTYSTYIGDKSLDEGYDITFFLPPKDKWTPILSAWLTGNKNLKCSGDKCYATIKSLDDIRQFALLLSNLKGVDQTIGNECALKAIEDAEKAAKLHNQKGVFAFTQEPIMTSTQAWISKCHKDYGILPPGLTEEQKTILQLIGADKHYGGCDFSQTDILPNQGYITYCQGVRKNPKSEINAVLTPSGFLEHAFHIPTPDPVATITITPSGKLYLVEVNMADMYQGDYLKKEVSKQLKDYFKMACKGDSYCSGEMNDNFVRYLASFLSNLHQAYNVSPTCMPHAVKYALDNAVSLPHGLAAHNIGAYPFTEDDWKKEVCSKVEAGKPVEVAKPPEKAPAEKPKKISPYYIKGITKAEKPPFKVGGCISTTAQKPTMIKAGYCAGVLEEYIKDGEVHTGLTNAKLTPTENWHQIGGNGKVIFDSKDSTLYITLPKELADIPEIANTLTLKQWGAGPHGYGMTKDSETTFHKLQSKSFWGAQSASIIALFLSHLANIHKLPPDCRQAAVDHAFKQAKTDEIKPIYPFTVEDWMKEVCKVEKPEEKPSELPAFAGKVLADLDIEDQHKIISFMVGSAQAGKESETTAKEIGEIFGLADISNLNAVAKTVIKSVTGVHDKTYYSAPWTADTQFGKVPIEILMCFAKKSPKSSTTGILILVSSNATPENKKLWQECVEEYEQAKLKEKPKPKFADLSFADKVKVEAFILEEEKKSNIYSISEAEEKWSFESDNELMNWYNQLLLKKAEKPEAETLDELIEKADKEYNKLISEIQKDKALIEKCKEATAYKKLPKKCKDLTHAYMNWMLLKGHKEGKSFEETLEDAKEMVISTFPKLTPLQVKLQLQLEKERKIRKGELPAEPGEKVSKKYGDLSPEEKQEVADFIEESEKDALLKASVMEKFGLEDSPMLDTVIKEAMGKKPALVDPYKALHTPWVYADLPMQTILEEVWKHIPDEVASCFASIVNTHIGGGWDKLAPISFSEFWTKKEYTKEEIYQWWANCVAGYEGKKKVSDLKEAYQNSIDLIIEGLAKQQKTAEEITDLILTSYPELEKADLLDYVIKKMGELVVHKIKGAEYWGDVIYHHKIKVAQHIEKLIGKPAEEIVSEVGDKFNVLITIDDVHKILEMLPSVLALQKEGKMVYNWLPASNQEIIKGIIKEKAEQGKSSGTITIELSKEYGLAASYDWHSLVDKAVEAEIAKISEPEYEIGGVAIPESVDKSIHNIVKNQLDQGLSLPNILQNVDSYLQGQGYKIPAKPLQDWFKSYVEMLLEEEAKPKMLKYPADFSAEETEKIENWIKYNCLGLTTEQCVEAVSKEYGIMPVEGLTLWVEEIMQKMEVGLEEKYYHDLDLTLQKAVKASALAHAKEALNTDDIMENIKEEFGLAESDELIDVILLQMYKATEGEIEKPKLTGQELAAFIYDKLHDAEGEKYVLGEMVHEVQQQYTAPEKFVLDTLEMLVNTEKIKKDKGGYYYLSGEEKPYLGKEELKKQILKLYHAAPNAALSFFSLVKKIQESYSVAQGNIGEANSELLLEGKIVYVAGDTHQIAVGEGPQPPVSAVAQAIQLIKEGKPYAGCYPDYPVQGFPEELVTYCEGILTPPGKKKAGYVQIMPVMGQKVPIIAHYGDGYYTTATSVDGAIGLDIKEMDKTGKEWKKRQMSVAEKLVKELGYECAFHDDSVACHKAPVDADLVRTTALFLSKLHDIDNLQTACVDYAVRDALEDAKDLNAHLGAQAYKNPIYPYFQAEWNDKVCAKIQIEPKRVDAKMLAQQMSTAQILDEAHKWNVDPSGSEEMVLKKLLDTGWMPPV